MSEVRIVCINKDGGNHQNPHEGITHYGWEKHAGNSGKSGRQNMVDWINKGNRAYVSDGYNKAYCRIRTSVHGNKFLQTVSDGRYSNNLLNLPECR